MKSFFLMGMTIFLVTGELMTTLKADHLHVDISEYFFNHPEGSVNYHNISEKVVNQGKANGSYGITPYQMKRKTMKPLFFFETDFQQTEHDDKNQLGQKISE